MVNIQTRSYLNYMLKTQIKAAKEQLCLECINVLAKYRGEISASTVPGQFIVPQSLNNYPLYIYSVMKSAPFSTWEDSAADLKVATMLSMLDGSLSSFIMKIYTRMYSLQEIRNDPEKWGGATDNFSIVKPVNIPASHEEFVAGDGYVFCTADFIYIFLPSTIDPELLFELTGGDKIEIESLPQLETDLNERFRSIIEVFRGEKRGAYQQVRILTDSTPKVKQSLQGLLVEDRKNLKDGFSYVQFVSDLHKLVLAKS